MYDNYQLIYRTGMRSPTNSVRIIQNLDLSSTFKGLFSQKIYVFCSPKSLGSSTILRSNEINSRASVNFIIAQASFWPRHLCRPRRKGVKESRRSLGKGDASRKRSGMKEPGRVKFDGERKVGYWLTETSVYEVLKPAKPRGKARRKTYTTGYVYTCDRGALFGGYTGHTDRSRWAHTDTFSDNSV
jgi:hypothetical protein